MERAACRSARVRALVQPAVVGLEHHGIDVYAASVARMDVVRVRTRAADRRLLGGLAESARRDCERGRAR